MCDFVGFPSNAQWDQQNVGSSQRARLPELEGFRVSIFGFHSGDELFGSELAAAKHGTEHTRGLRHKLRVAGAPAGLPAFARAGSKPAAASSSAPEPTLQKKSSSTACSFAREGCAAGEWRITYTSASGSPSGLVAKCLTPGEKMDKLGSTGTLLPVRRPRDAGGAVACNLVWLLH